MIRAIFVRTFLGVMFSITCVQAQGVYVEPSHPVYRFLERMDARQASQLDLSVQPLTRNVIASHLIAVGKPDVRLTQVDRALLQFYTEEFAAEISRLDSSKGQNERRYAFIYDSDLFSVRVSPIGIVDQRFESESKKNFHWGWGLRFHGSIGDRVGFWFRFTDNSLSGDKLDPYRAFTPEQGVVPLKIRERSYEYSTIEAGISADWNWLTLDLSKSGNVLGNGWNGQLIHSEKAPSYPMLRLRAQLTPWLAFHYFHGFLVSTDLDSSRMYTVPTGETSFLREVKREKYLAVHSIIVRPWSWLEVMLGESVVYSDTGVEPLYLIPIIFFRSASHNASLTDDNVQFFGCIRANVVRNVTAYGSIFIDEFTLTDALDKEKQRNQVGFQGGVLLVDPLIPNLELRLEAARLLPWVYSNRYPASTYANNGFVLGHWIDQNADQLFLEATYRPSRAVGIKAFAELTRRGGRADVKYQYEYPSLPFLYGDVLRQTRIGGGVTFEPWHDAVAFADLILTTQKADNPSIDTKQFSFRLGLRYAY